jgi:molecular chaperone HtpG
MFSFPYIYEYDKKQIKSIDKSDIKFEDETESDDKLAENDSATIIEKFKSVLGDRVEDVKISNRLVDSPASLVVGSQGLDPQMEKMMQMMDKDYKGGKRILEINASHPLIKNLAKINSTDSNNQILNDSIVQIFEGTSLIEGYLKSPIDFYNRMVGFMVKATKE